MASAEHEQAHGHTITAGEARFDEDLPFYAPSFEPIPIKIQSTSPHDGKLASKHPPDFLTSVLHVQEIVQNPTSTTSSKTPSSTESEDVDKPQAKETLCQAFSRGSVGHPRHCAGPCKYASKPNGCKDGVYCNRCHRCKWHRSAGRAKRVLDEPLEPAYIRVPICIDDLIH